MSFIFLEYFQFLRDFRSNFLGTYDFFTFLTMICFDFFDPTFDKLLEIPKNRFNFHRMRIFIVQHWGMFRTIQLMLDIGSFYFIYFIDKYLYLLS